MRTVRPCSLDVSGRKSDQGSPGSAEPWGSENQASLCASGFGVVMLASSVTIQGHFWRARKRVLTSCLRSLGYQTQAGIWGKSRQPGTINQAGPEQRGEVWAGNQGVSLHFPLRASSQGSKACTGPGCGLAAHSEHCRAGICELSSFLQDMCNRQM